MRERSIIRFPFIFALHDRMRSIFRPVLPDEAMKNPAVSFYAKRSDLILASLTINLLALALPIMTLQVYDRILVSENIGTVRVLAAGVCVVIVLDGILRLVRSYVVNWASAAYEHCIACNSMRHMLAAELSALERQGTGEQVQRMGSIGKLRDFFSGQALITLIDLPFVLIFLALISYLAGYLVFVPIVLLVLFALVAWHLGLNLKRALIRREKIDESRMGFIIETLNGIHTVKSLGLEAMFQRHYEQLQAQSSLANYRVAKESNTASNYGALFTQGMIIGIIGFGAPMAMQGGLTLGTLIACVLLSGRIMQPIQRALGVWTRFQDFQLARVSVGKTFELPALTRVGAEALGNKDGKLELNDLTFSYGPDEPILFDHLSLRLERGQSISVSGDHSSGKTTLLKLMAGLYGPTQGSILINGVAATQYPARELIKHIGYLAMEGTIFRGTIMENLTAFGEIPEKNSYELIGLLGMDKEIAKLPAGFETKLEGSTADPIPPGLKQRIAIARVLAYKPRVLLFDNADRALDKEGYNQLYRLLARLKSKITMVIVTDDRNILRLAKNEYVLTDGKLVERAFSDDSKIHDVLPYQELRL